LCVVTEFCLGALDFERGPAINTLISHTAAIRRVIILLHLFVGQDGILRPIGNRPCRPIRNSFTRTHELRNTPTSSRLALCRRLPCRGCFLRLSREAAL